MSRCMYTKMNGLICFFIILKFTYIVADVNDDIDLEVTDTIDSVTIYHQLPGSSYSYRGVINFHRPYTLANNVQQNSLTKDEYDLLNVSSGKGDIYKLKYVVKSRLGKENVFHSFIKANKVIQSNLTDTIDILIDLSKNQIISFNHLASRKVQENQGRTGVISYTASNFDFKTTVNFNNPEKGPTPDVATFITKLQREKDARKAIGKDNRPFLAKYWYYIIPILALVLLAGSPMGNQEGGGR